MKQKKGEITMMEFNILLDDEDYIAFNQYHLEHSGLGKRNELAMKWLIPCFCLFCIIIFVIAGAETGLLLSEAVVLILCSVIWLFCYKKFILKITERKIKSLKKMEKLPYEENSKIIFNEQEMCEMTANTITQTKYRTIQKVCVADRAIYIYVDMIRAYIIPNATFRDLYEKEQFLEFLKTKVDESIFV
jgi:hypothetical protein